MINNQQLLLLNRFDLYNNIATLEGNEGRLRVEMVIDPFPRIEWNFEILGSEKLLSGAGIASGVLEGTLSGFQFMLEDSSLMYFSSSVDSRTYGGTSANAYSGQWEETYNDISFFLPNAQCVVTPMTGGLSQHEYRVVSKPGEAPDLTRAFPKRSMGAGWECMLNDKWAVWLEYTKETQQWLKAPESYGTLLTVQGRLVCKRNDDPSETAVGVSLQSARSILERLCDLLSFANGGYLGPTIVKARNLSLPKEAILYGAYMTTPIELLGHTWLSLQCDLRDYLSCFASFDHMLQSKKWKNLYELVLIWYFQAIQPSSAQVKGKPWQIAVVALAALLERLTYEILDELTGEKRMGAPEKRLKRVLQHIGIPLSKSDDEIMVDLFFKFRNNAIHPVQTKSYSVEELELVFDYGALWVEEIMLWRLGYQGKYRNRLRREGHFVFDAPRYDITARHLSWV